MTAPTAPIVPPEAISLKPFVDSGVLRSAEIQAAALIARTMPGTEHEVLLAAALCVRALQLGHVCIELDRVAASVVVERSHDAQGDDDTSNAAGLEMLDWPDPTRWVEVLQRSPVVAWHDAPPTAEPTARSEARTLPLVVHGHRVYLERYWRYERAIGDRLLGATSDSSRAASPSEIDAVLNTYFGPDLPGTTNMQRLAVSVALRNRVTVIAGGPGTGKTYTVARLLAAAHEIALSLDTPLSVALAAPTGKAAARMSEAVHQAVSASSIPSEVAAPLLATEAGTLHRLLGSRHGISFHHDHNNPLPHDLVVIDETSMVDLPMLAKLLDALRPSSRLVLVGDPYQLASVEAGAVLGDIVGPAARGPAEPSAPLIKNVVVLDRVHRFAADSAIARLADAVRNGDADAALDLLRDGTDDTVCLVDPNDVAALSAVRGLAAQHAASMVEAALAGDAEAAMATATELKVLSGTRWGPQGSYAWRDDIERRLNRLVPDIRTDRAWYAGRPVIVTSNDYIAGVFNGDTGIVVSRDGSPMVAMTSPDGLREFAPFQLEALETWWAMTVHKSQGSEFAHAVVALPQASSRVLSNELLYTAITRGKERVTVVATEEAVRAAILRPITRASGLQDRLWPA